ncbi:hypothetical protein [Streptomyces coffeae]|uniref:Uncharacterized protein n=1 Tax=Streptomyces coffeae TaxID=621382 RepID=A0ABS1NSE3_9ACTN|nr:hypothetical protein [Streptomyces coffeae]MBL1102671.1 hypothetical protein [Streptomyces coffeae]
MGETQAPDKSWQALALRYDGRKWTNVRLSKGTAGLNSVAISQGDSSDRKCATSANASHGTP